MRRSVVVATIVVMLAAPGCVRRISSPLALNETHTFPVVPDKLVRLDVGSFDVAVKVAPANEISVNLDLDARSSSRGAARRWLENHTPRFEDSEAALEVRLPARRRGVFVIGYLNTKARIELTVPPACRLEIRTTSGNVAIAGEASLTGPVRVDTSSGDLAVTGGLRELIVKTSSGDVNLTRQPLVALTADTSSGDVTLESGAERGIIDTSSGDVRLEKLTGELSATTTSGEVAASWDTLAAGTKIRIHTTSGDVRIRIPATATLAGEINTTSGGIQSDVEGTHGRRDHQLGFAAPGAAAEIEVRTTSGDVSLHGHP